MPKPLLLSLSISVLFSGCVTVRDGVVCTAAGQVSDGAVCSHTIQDKTFDMTFEEYIAFLEPQPETSDSPGRGGAVCMSSEDFQNMKTALEQACRYLGNKCKFQKILK